MVTAGWTVALIVLLIIRDSLPAGERWWIWTCAAGLALGLFGFWYVPWLKGRRARTEERQAARRASAASESRAAGQAGDRA